MELREFHSSKTNHRPLDDEINASALTHLTAVPGSFWKGTVHELIERRG
jgi:hypothetical protein